MLFNTVEYGLFLIVVLALVAALRRQRRSRHVVLLLASYAFYGAWNVKYLGLILFSTLLDYGVGLAIASTDAPATRRALLALSVTGNLGVLATFKYFDFFAESLAALLAEVGIHSFLPSLDVLLPVGISFYTFQTLSYTIDIYRRRIEARRSFFDVALFVAFFPQLVAGPIVRASHFLPQLDVDPPPDAQRTSRGLYRILTGLCKKMVIADFLGAHIVDHVFAAPHSHGAADTWVAVYGYALQIYGDFAGYSDMAIGSALLLGFSIPENFAAPYKATDLRDFWRRWHISLSTWLRDYLYIPLGGSRHGPLRTYAGLMITMVLGGLWHGAGWNFVAWGALHGVGLVLTRMIQRITGACPSGPLARFVGWLLTFHLVCAGWILFRAADFHTALEIYGALGSGATARWLTAPVIAVLAFGFATHFMPENVSRWAEQTFVRIPAAGQAAILVLALAVFQTMALASHPFIYYQF